METMTAGTTHDERRFIRRERINDYMHTYLERGITHCMEDIKASVRTLESLDSLNQPSTYKKISAHVWECTQCGHTNATSQTTDIARADDKPLQVTCDNCGASWSVDSYHYGD